MTAVRRGLAAGSPRCPDAARSSSRTLVSPSRSRRSTWSRSCRTGHRLHPLWLALLLLAGQACRSSGAGRRPVGIGLVIGAARISYDKIGFGFAPMPLGPAIAVYTVFDRRGPAFR